MKKMNLLTIGVAIVFLAAAIIVLGDLLNLLKANNIFGQFWPIVLVFIGVFAFSASSKSNSFAFGLIILGILFTLRNLGIFASQSGDVIFIVLLCLAGLAMLVMSTEKKPSS
jgi:hypothetical protein